VQITGHSGPSAGFPQVLARPGARAFPRPRPRRPGEAQRCNRSPENGLPELPTASSFPSRPGPDGGFRTGTGITAFIAAFIRQGAGCSRNGCRTNFMPRPTSAPARAAGITNSSTLSHPALSHLARSPDTFWNRSEQDLASAADHTAQQLYSERAGFNEEVALGRYIQKKCRAPATLVWPRAPLT
jgi:hypothetical protein